MSFAQQKIAETKENVKKLFPGLLVAVLVAITAQFIADHYGAPAMLMALLLGIALHFLSEEGPTVEGVQFAGSSLLRIGVCLLGARINVELISMLGFNFVMLIIAGVVITILFGWLIGLLFGADWRFAVLTAGSVAICGASAAIAISAVLPKTKGSERNLIFTILSVTVLSTIAMIGYPILTRFIGLDEITTGVFIGGTIHDVAQVVGAGFSISEETGEFATVSKLIRVSMLAPIVLILSIIVRLKTGSDQSHGKKAPLIPLFVLGFLALAAINSMGLLSHEVVEFINSISRWALLVAIAAIGMKTSLKRVMDVGSSAIILIVTETVFLAIFILIGIGYLS
ncbi:MAG: YeiH family putative sulfate export transporter [Rhizobiales bacterium]|nr:YeiH family protein [Hyphomicrobiales bacterium]NRB13341.1 YeiH family putative sulfate export transporter [Hyphomicrobiales bacterium]